MAEISNCGLEILGREKEVTDDTQHLGAAELRQLEALCTGLGIGGMQASAGHAQTELAELDAKLVVPGRGSVCDLLAALDATGIRKLDVARAD